MTTQIAVGLPDEIVEFLDRLVAQGAAKSRAAAVTRALDQDRRRRMAEHDAAIRSLHVARFGQAPKAGESNMEIAVSDVVSDRFPRGWTPVARDKVLRLAGRRMVLAGQRSLLAIP